MTVYTVGAAIQFICVLVNGCMILFNYSNYRKYHTRIFLGTLTFSTLMLLFCATFLIFDAGKVSGTW